MSFCDYPEALHDHTCPGFSLERIAELLEAQTNPDKDRLQVAYDNLRSIDSTKLTGVDTISLSRAEGILRDLLR